MLDQSLQVVVNREARRDVNVITDAGQLSDLLNKETNVMTGSAFEKGEIIEITPEKAVLMEGSIGRNGTSNFRLLVKTNKGTKNLFLTTFYKRRTLVKPNAEGVEVVTGEGFDNYNSEVGLHFASCPTQLIFLASILGCKMICDESKRLKVAGYNPKGGPNGNGGVDTDPSHAVNATFPFFKFTGSTKPVIKEEWLKGGEEGDKAAAQYIVDFFAGKAKG